MSVSFLHREKLRARSRLCTPLFNDSAILGLAWLARPALIRPSAPRIKIVNLWLHFYQSKVPPIPHRIRLSHFCVLSLLCPTFVTAAYSLCRSCTISVKGLSLISLSIAFASVFVFVFVFWLTHLKLHFPHACPTSSLSNTAYRHLESGFRQSTWTGSGYGYCILRCHRYHYRYRYHCCLLQA